MKRRYKYTVNSCVKRIVNAWKEGYLKGRKQKTIKFDYSNDFLDIEIEAKIKFRKGSFKVDGYSTEGDDYTSGHILIQFLIDPEWLPNYWSEIYFELCDVIRHEIEHQTQSGWNLKSDKYIADDRIERELISAKLLSKHFYFMLPKEVDANLQGMAFKARKQKRNFVDVINEYLDRVNITQLQKEEVLACWRKRAPHIGGLPKF